MNQIGVVQIGLNYRVNRFDDFFYSKSIIQGYLHCTLLVGVAYILFSLLVPYSDSVPSAKALKALSGQTHPKGDAPCPGQPRCDHDSL